MLVLPISPPGDDVGAPESYARSISEFVRESRGDALPLPPLLPSYSLRRSESARDTLGIVVRSGGGGGGGSSSTGACVRSA
jgi:hypothetical protein